MYTLYTTMFFYFFISTTLNKSIDTGGVRKGKERDGMKEFFARLGDARGQAMWG